MIIKTIKTAAAILAMGVSVPAFAQDEAATDSPFAKFATFDAESPRTIDYGPIDEFFDAVTVDSRGRRNVRYGPLKGDGEKILNQFANFMSGINPAEFTKDEQLAYWLNLRNILVVKAILADGGSRAIRRQRGTFEEPGELWTRKRLSVDGVALSIDDIERSIILANWNNPDIIYGLYQGVKGGPALATPATFSGQNVAEQLSSHGKKYINSRNVVRIRRDEVRVPEVFDWYKQALFAGDDAQIIAHITAHAESNLAKDIGESTSLAFESMNYSLDKEQTRNQAFQGPRGSSGPVGGTGS